MKIKIKMHGMSGIVKKFNNKYDLYEYTKKYLNDTIFSNSNDEKLKNKILNSKNMDNFRIYELIELLDGDMIK